MSVFHKSQTNWLKDLEKYLRGMTVTGPCGDRKNIRRWQDAFCLWTCVLTDSCYQSDGRKVEKNLLAEAYCQGDLTLTAMKKLLLRLRRFTCVGGNRYRHFKRALLHDIEGVGPILDLLEPALQDFFFAPSHVTFLRLNDLLSFLGKLTIENDLLEQEAIQKFRDNDNIVITASDSEIKAVRSVITAWLEDFQPDLTFGYHGPGASAGLSRRDSFPDAKFDRLFCTPLLKYAGCPVDGLPVVNQPSSEVVFVPKSFDSKRTICKVPAGLMFWQKAVQQQLYAYVEHSPLRRHLCFSRQDFSQRMALKGSRDDSFCTIDLSAASDSVSWEIVKSVFRGSSLIRIMYATRTKQFLLPDGSSLYPKKYDPMGSALTFPVESLLFAAICEISSTKKQPRYRVYGDDIVFHPADIDSQDLIARLTRFGFKVNTEKSYTSGPFREACGMEAYQGWDVTPIRLSREWRYLTAKCPDDVVKLRDLANKCFWRGYKMTRSYIIAALLRTKFSENICFSYEPSEDRWISTAASNFHLKTRFNTNLWRTEYRVLQDLKKRSRGKDENAYYTWCSERYLRVVVLPEYGYNFDPTLPRRGSSGTGQLKVRRRVGWLPL